MDWDELLRRVQFIRGLYAEHKVPLKVGEGLAIALDEAEATARGVPYQGEATDEVIRWAVHVCSVIWALHDSLRGCVDAGLNVKGHLGQLTTGTVDFGQPAGPNERTHFFKDFEAELLVAAMLARAGLPVQFLEEGNDPRGEMQIEQIFVEVKHPNSQKKLQNLLRDFDAEMRKNGTIGVFVTAIEDAFRLGDAPNFTTAEDFRGWQSQKNAQIEVVGRMLVRRAASLTGIGAMIQTSTSHEMIGGASRLARYANAVVFDQREYAHGTLPVLERIAAVFAPQFSRYTAIAPMLAPPNTDKGGT